MGQKKKRHLKRSVKIALCLLMVFSIVLIVISILPRDGKAYSKNILGTWYYENGDIAFSLYDDGSCEISGEYGLGNWQIVNNQTLRMTNIYGETETAKIYDLDKEFLRLGENGESVFYKDPVRYNVLDNHDEKGSPSDAGNIDVFSENKQKNLNDYSNFENNQLVDQNDIIKLYEHSRRYLGEFINGSAHVIVDDVNYIIDHSGKILYTNETTNGIWSRDKWTGAYLITYGGEYGNDIVLDTNGKLIFMAEEGQSILAIGEGLILIFEEALGFEAAEAKVGIIDFEGNKIYSFSSNNYFINEEKTNLRQRENIRYCGEGVFVADTNIVYHYGTDETVFLDAYTGNSFVLDGLLLSEYFNNTALFMFTGNGNHGHNILTNHNGDTMKDYGDFGLKDLSEGKYLVQLDWGNGKFQCYLYSFPDNYVKELSQYRNLVVENYLNGYALCTMTGADNNQYFSVLDQDGNFIFEPVLDKYDTFDCKRNEITKEGLFYRNRLFSLQDGTVIHDYDDGNFGLIKEVSEGVIIKNGKDGEEYYADSNGDIILDELF